MKIFMKGTFQIHWKKKIAKSFGLSVFTVFFKHKRTTGHKPNTHKTILKNKRSQQKHAIRLVHKKGIYCQTKEFTKYFFLHAWNKNWKCFCYPQLLIQHLRNLTHIQYISQAQIIANQKLNSAQIGSKYLYKFSIYGTILLEYRERTRM